MKKRVRVVLEVVTDSEVFTPEDIEELKQECAEAFGYDARVESSSLDVTITDVGEPS